MGTLASTTYSHTQYSFPVMLGGTERRKEERTKERRWTKLKFLRLVFSTLLRVSGTYIVDLSLE